MAPRCGHVGRNAREALHRRPRDRRGLELSGTIDYGLPEGEGTIGGYRGSCELLFTGDLDNVKIWNQALPIADIWRRLSALLGSPTIQ